MKTKMERRIARRNWIAGLLAGLIIATVFGAYAATTFKKMVAGKPATAADVNTAHQDLATAIDALEAKVTAQAVEISKLKTAPDCPPGFTRDTTATTITLCKRGADEMVKAGSYWIDRYEASLVDTTLWAGGKCNGAGGTHYSASSKNTYPAGFPATGNWTTKVHACSIKGKRPSRHMNWLQATQACMLAGKSLCTNAEWQGAAAGTPDDAVSCNLATGGPKDTGIYPKCVSSYGAYDMVGNLWELVSWWTVAGKTWITTNGQHVTPWPAAFGGDETANVNGTARAGTGTGTFTAGLPAVGTRGGGYSSTTKGGQFAIALNSSPAGAHYLFSTRCCLR